jgi:hypothetical protein
VQRLEDLLGGFRSSGQPPQHRQRKRWPLVVVGVSALAAAAALIVVMATRKPVIPGWRVDTIAGVPRCGNAPCGELRPGDWLETDAVGRARIAVANIGHMDVEPDSRLRLVKSDGAGHRLELARGTVSAAVTAPPRLLIVDTPAAAAVDLGCAYTLTVEADGMTRIHVTSGWVSLETKDRSTFIPAGAVAYAHPVLGPSIPINDDATDALRAAALQRDVDVDVILKEARKKDALTVWHLISRVPEGAGRERVVTRLEELVPRPDGVTRDAVLHGDKAALERWRKETASTGWWKLGQ